MNILSNNSQKKESKHSFNNKKIYICIIISSFLISDICFFLADKNIIFIFLYLIFSCITLLFALKLLIPWIKKKVNKRVIKDKQIIKDAVNKSNNYGTPQQINQPNIYSPEKRYIYPSGILDNEWLAYSSAKNRICLIDHTAKDFSGHAGEEITFFQEPDNPYDGNAVGIMLNGVHLGYVYKNDRQEMFNKWIERSLPIKAFILTVDTEKNIVEYAVAFYRKISDFTSKTFSLTHVNKERKENLECVSENDEIDIEYDDFSESWIASGTFGEIGQLPASATKFFDEYQPIVAICEELLYNDDYEVKGAKVKVFVK